MDVVDFLAGTMGGSVPVLALLALAYVIGGSIAVLVLSCIFVTGIVGFDIRRTTGSPDSLRAFLFGLGIPLGIALPTLIGRLTIWQKDCRPISVGRAIPKGLVCLLLQQARYG